MKKVKIKKWIPIEYENEKRIKGTGCFETEFSTSGLFHKWGSSYEEFEIGVGNFTVAIVETMDGKVHEVLIHNIKFV